MADAQGGRGKLSEVAAHWARLNSQTLGNRKSLKVCALCKQNREIRKSHFIPQAVFKLCRNDASSSPHPVAVFENVAFRSAYQYEQPLLCDECEDRFSSHGERDVIPMLLNASGRFKLKQELKESARLPDKAGEIYSARENYGDLADALFYFGASIIWRGSATDWRIGKQERRPNKLGTYQEQFRLYLLNEGPMPSNTTLLLFIAKEDSVTPNISLPSGQKKVTYHIHRFYVPGVEFRFLVGSEIPYKPSYDPRRHIPIVVQPFAKNAYMREMLRFTSSAIPKGSLAKEDWIT